MAYLHFSKPKQMESGIPKGESTMKEVVVKLQIQEELEMMEVISFEMQPIFICQGVDEALNKRLCVFDSHVARE